MESETVNEHIDDDLNETMPLIPEETDNEEKVGEN